VRCLVDECTGPVVAQWLQTHGHDVFSVYEQARGLEDRQILTKAAIENRIIVTNDKDFGEMIFREGRPHRGVVLLRLDDESPTNKIKVLQQLLDRYESQLADNFTVATETTVRIVHLRQE
jgi:predicted nuclease of predicted toxin-antitoxin system